VPGRANGPHALGLRGEAAGDAHFPRPPAIAHERIGVIAQGSVQIHFLEIHFLERAWLCHGLGILRADREFHLER
jgi:hypothetical protein